MVNVVARWGFWPGAGGNVWRGKGRLSVQNPEHYWFRAKRHGWGWGLPLTWEGWASLAVFMALVVAAVVVFPPYRALVPFVVCVVALNGLLVAVCWLKGEPPRWR
ncbi:MAG: hypothetical protein POG74_01420 [Acidocella sp.]|nr:hypothetical protein [Acidocella sp.]